MRLLGRYAWRIKNSLLSVLKNKTIGARALVIQDQEILLVKHSYLANWYLPGGGVDASEHPICAIKREVAEEVGIILEKDPILFGIYLNRREKRDDFVVIYVVKDWKHMLNHKQDGEISDSRFFDLNDLPTDISPATARRIAEYQQRQPIDPNW